MTLMLDLVAATRRMTYGSMADQLNFLSAEYLLGDAELSMSMDVTNITPGMVMSSGLNVWYVTGIDAANKKVYVYASYDNSHNDALPIGSPVMLRPRVTDWLLFNYINDVVTSLSSPTYGLYREASWASTADAIWGTYDIPVIAQNMTSLLRVQVQYPTTTDVWLDIPPNMYEWQPENSLVRLRTMVPASSTVRFDYRAPFVPATLLTSNVVDDMGLSESMLDIPPLGASVRLLRTTESRRAQTHNQSDPRRAEEVQRGQNSSAATDMAREFRDRVQAEHTRLLNRNPYTRPL